ncbi:hypothetical protein HHI36_019415 [Cryptolaemus montrouzieri]|uniref:Uncharacterized protein n=1 Tax=Cryptolaemus montrouzieri TaxID=559131 RepID=A0ABD2P322_9CUCU
MGKILTDPDIRELQKQAAVVYTIARVRKDQDSAELYKKLKLNLKTQIEKLMREDNSRIINEAENKGKAIWKSMTTSITPSSSLLENKKRSQRSMFLHAMTPQEILKELSRIGRKTSRDVYGFSVRLLGDVAPILVIRRPFPRFPVNVVIDPYGHVLF